MNREIKFRGRDINGQWQYGYLFQGETEDKKKYALILKQNRYTCNNDLPKECPFAFYEDEISVVNPDTVGQYIGAKDKYGTEIYEGDIIKYKTYKGVVEFDNLFYEYNIKVSEKYEESFWYEYFKEAEVIDDIYDNPDFFKNE